MALQKLYDFIYDSFCDWYIELVKPRQCTAVKPLKCFICTCYCILVGASHAASVYAVYNRRNLAGNAG